MGGSSKGNSSESNKTAPTSPVVPVANMQRFGGILDPEVMKQLEASGLLGSIANAGMYQGNSVPMLSTPDDVRYYLASQGKSYVNNDGSTGSVSGATPATSPANSLLEWARANPTKF